MAISPRNASMTTTPDDEDSGYDNEEDSSVYYDDGGDEVKAEEYGDSDDVECSFDHHEYGDPDYYDFGGSTAGYQAFSIPSPAPPSPSTVSGFASVDLPALASPQPGSPRPTPSPLPAKPSAVDRCEPGQANTTDTSENIKNVFSLAEKEVVDAEAAFIDPQKTTDERRVKLNETLEKVGAILDTFPFHEGDAIDGELADIHATPKDIHDRLMAINKLLSIPGWRVREAFRASKYVPSHDELVGGARWRGLKDHPALTKLRDISQKLRAKVDVRLARCNPEDEKIKGPSSNWTTAAVLARLSGVVYNIKKCDDDEKRLVERRCKSFIPGGMLDFDYVCSENRKIVNVALVVVSPSSIYLVFRGTMIPANWIQNGKVARRHFPISSSGGEQDDQKGNVHRGFLEAQESLWGGLMAPEFLLRRSLDSPRFGDSRLQNFYIGGHSLGGAMAVITAARLVNELDVKRIDAVYTFGSPGVFDRYATNRYSEHPVLRGRTFRVEYERDLVPKLFRRLRFHFFHPGDSRKLREPTARPHKIESYIAAVDFNAYGKSAEEKLISRALEAKQEEIAKLENTIAKLKAESRLLRRELSC